MLSLLIGIPCTCTSLFYPDMVCGLGTIVHLLIPISDKGSLKITVHKSLDRVQDHNRGHLDLNKLDFSVMIS